MEAHQELRAAQRRLAIPAADVRDDDTRGGVAELREEVAGEEVGCVGGGGADCALAELPLAAVLEGQRCWWVGSWAMHLAADI